MIALPQCISFGGGSALACGPMGELHAEELHGLFVCDTRVLSTYSWSIGGHAWRLLSSSRPHAAVVQWDLQNPQVRAPGGDIPEGTVHMRLRRCVAGAMHDDVTITSYASAPIAVRLAVALDADFADVFQVKSRSLPPQLDVCRVPRHDGLSLRRERGTFRRGLDVRWQPSFGTPCLVGSQITFDVVLQPGRPWRCCIDAIPIVDDVPIALVADPHARDPSPSPRQSVAIECAPRLSGPFARGLEDLARLAIREGDGAAPYIAAGAPWFIALFGRDTLVTSLMASMVGTEPTDGALTALAATQATARIDFHDAEPGKIAHELRRGELAQLGRIPHTPYYGAHDAPALFALALWNAYRWTGDRTLLDRHMPAAEAAMRWCETDGDADGDGLLEYRTRSRQGLRNQGWKDSGDAIVDEAGRLVEPPIATVELQGYWYAARLAFAELLAVTDRGDEATRNREAALALRERVEDRFWIDEADCYALALDAAKRPIASITSNPGHLLWCGLPRPDRARRLARRLMQDDMFSGFGIRTLSANHRAYNPLSYQLGSVWPHDSALCAAGLMRYGLRDDAARVFAGLLDAADAFEMQRLPELWCGLARDDGPPVPYDRANAPQAWAAAVPVLIAQLLLGLVPDVPRGCCWIDPWLPPWLSELTIQGVPLGDGALRIRLRRVGAQTRIEDADHPSVRVVEGAPATPLWGRPLAP